MKHRSALDEDLFKRCGCGREAAGRSVVLDPLAAQTFVAPDIMSLIGKSGTRVYEGWRVSRRTIGR